MSINTKMVFTFAGLVLFLIAVLYCPKFLYWFYGANSPQDMSGEYKEIYFKAADIGVVTIQLLFALNGGAATLLINCLGGKADLSRAATGLKDSACIFSWGLLFSVLAAGCAYASFFFSEKYDVLHNPGIWGACVFAVASASVFVWGLTTAAESLFDERGSRNEGGSQP